ncbi:hypothetical protein H8S11_00875 [Flintibacter sp. NSJ-23]|uniref:Rhomboid family intramembrane serine protease n=1 Tax=Flintibacter hominis TaxID=2763048 RepID=A0A8J6IZ90_9FIRM|nr:hypothetical protein [Flintibacter hominis]MBS5591143.1 hypothetical protein [Clostridiales bacterium]
MKYIALGNVFVYIADMLTNGWVSMFIRFYPELILQGQVWRLVTFIFSPLSVGGGFWGPFFFAVTTYFYYWIGSSLERQWGSTRFTVFYGLGVLLNIVVGIVTYLLMPITSNLSGYYFETATMYYVNLSMFFSFATLYPDMQVLLYGIIPLKVKWLAWLDAIFFTYDIFGYLTGHTPLRALLPVIAILNYLIFFWEDLMSVLGRGSERIRYRTSPQTINFKKAQKDVKERKGYLHKCAVCGLTDADDPNMEFRYCSKCNGYYCYCMKHINDHTHVQ